MTDAGGEGDIRGGDHYEEVLRGENVVSISQKGEGDITSLVDVNQACLLFLKTLIGLQGCNKGDLFLSTRAPREQEGIIDSQEATRTESLEFLLPVLNDFIITKILVKS